MPRILFDHNVPAPLRHLLTNHVIRTAEEEGWEQIANGELVSRAEEHGFEILLTCDQNLAYQQNLSARKLALVVMGSNIWPLVKQKVTEISAALSDAAPGSFCFIELRIDRRKP